MPRRLRFRALDRGSQFICSRWAILLLPLSWLWRLGAKLRNWAYERGWLAVEHVERPVVSIGNLAVGGTGKTPLVILLAKQFPTRRIAILARGYGASSHDWNDEMQVIRRHLPHALLYQGKDRVALARQAVQEGAELLLLDDGFQHRALFRDFDCVLVRPADFQGRCLPAGELRETAQSLKRADLALSYAPLPHTVHLALETAVFDQQGQPIRSLRGEPVALFCGIGNPERFLKTVESRGAKIVQTLFLADHEPMELAQLHALYRSSAAKFLLCTEKDFVKLPSTDLPVAWVQIQAQVVGQEELWRRFLAKIEQKLHHRSAYGRTNFDHPTEIGGKHCQRDRSPMV